MKLATLWFYVFGSDALAPHVTIVGDGGAVLGGTADVVLHHRLVVGPIQSSGVGLTAFQPRKPKPQTRSIALDSTVPIILGGSAGLVCGSRTQGAAAVGVGGGALTGTGRGLIRETDDEEILLLLAAA